MIGEIRHYHRTRPNADERGLDTILFARVYGHPRPSPPMVNSYG